MSRDDQERLLDIKAAIEAIREHRAKPGTQPGGPYESVLHDALLFQLIVIGEAVKSLADELKDRERNIPWAQIAAQRDFIAHAYFRVSMTRILNTVTNDLPPLEEAIDRLLVLGPSALDDTDEGRGD